MPIILQINSIPQESFKPDHINLYSPKLKPHLVRCLLLKYLLTKIFIFLFFVNTKGFIQFTFSMYVFLVIFCNLKLSIM
jgi:hypothetical protein